MTLSIWILLAVASSTVLLLATERVPPDIAAFLGVSALIATGTLSVEDALSSFSNPAPIAVGAMFVLSAGLQSTGAVARLATFMERHAGRSMKTVLLLALPLVMVLSAFLTNTLVVVFFAPIFASLARERGSSPGQVLMPLSFAAILGGMCTVIGTSTNLVVSALMAAPAGAGQTQLEPIGMFELAWVGLPLSAIGLAYLLTVGQRLLPRDAIQPLASPETQREYLSEITLREGSGLIGLSPRAKGGALPKGVSVLHVSRRGQRLIEPLAETRMEKGDTLLLSAAPKKLRQLNRTHAVLSADELELVKQREATVFEAVVGPGSDVEGLTLRDVALRQIHGAIPFAIQHHGRPLGPAQDFRDVPLTMGDVVLVLGTREARMRLRHAGLFVLMDDDHHDDPTNEHKLGWSLAILAALVGLVSFGVLPLVVVSLMAAIAMVVTGCVEPAEAYRSVQWNLVLLIVGMLALGRAIETTGAASLLAETVLGPILSLGPGLAPWVAVAAVVFLTGVLTEFISNAAAAALMVPLALSMAAALGVNPRPLCMAVVFGASTCFASPVGYQTNTFVYGVGGYRFSDFVRVGLPLKIALSIGASLLIPFVWPTAS
ncbi:MAG: SLC13 family permease [Planctomycetota bacterium]|jgi:di/tricarboxylate transporter